MGPKVSTNTDVSSLLQVRAEQGDASLFSRPATHFGARGWYDCCGSGSGHRGQGSVANIDQGALQADKMRTANWNILCHSGLRIPCPQVSRPGERRHSNSSQRRWSVWTEDGAVQRKVGVCMLPLQTCMDGAQAQDRDVCAVVAAVVCYGIAWATIEIDSQVGIAAGTEEMRPAGIEAEYALLHRSARAACAEKCHGRRGWYINLPRIDEAIEQQ